jgi:prepilin-type N-terminal cleavage/methylation domain-containing protein
MCTADSHTPPRSGRRNRLGRATRSVWKQIAGYRARRNQGFTLIELANVIMIISVITLIGLPAITDSHASVKRTSCAERQRRIFEAAILYAAENIVPNGDQNVTVLIPDYIKREVAECPESVSPDYDDYTIHFFDGRPIDVTCDIEGVNHPWMPH